MLELLVNVNLRYVWIAFQNRGIVAVHQGMYFSIGISGLNGLEYWSRTNEIADIVTAYYEYLFQRSALLTRAPELDASSEISVGLFNPART